MAGWVGATWLWGQSCRARLLHVTWVLHDAAEITSCLPVSWLAIAVLPHCFCSMGLSPCLPHVSSQRRCCRCAGGGGGGGRGSRHL